MRNRYVLLAKELRGLCTQLHRAGSTKFPSEAELSARYGYSRQTVRKALDLLEREGSIVRIRGSGTYLSADGRGRAGKVAVITAYTEEYLYPQLLRDIGAELSRSGYEMQRFGSGNRILREREILQHLIQNPPEGILLEGAKTALPSPNLDLLRQLDQKGIPIIYLHAPLPVPRNAAYVLDDNEGGARMLVRHLLDRGHQQIAGIFKSDDRQGIERYRGYLAELLEAGQTVPEESILWYDTEDRDRLMNGQYNRLDRFVHFRLGGCTAVVCYNDEIAYPLIQCLLMAGKRVPEDVAVVSFDNSHYCRQGPVTITSLGHEKHQMGSSAALALLAKMRGKQVRSVFLPWIIYERESG